MGMLFQLHGKECTLGVCIGVWLLSSTISTVGAVDCKFGSAPCNTYAFVLGFCCVNNDENARIQPCSHPDQGGLNMKYVVREPNHRCGDKVAVQNRFCSTTVVEACGGDVARGACTNVDCVTE